MKTTFIIVLFLVISCNIFSQPAIQWQNSIGGNNAEYSNHIIQLNDGSFLAAGYSESNDGDFSGNHGNSDFAVVKLNSSGQISWQKQYGGSEDDVCTSFVQTADGSFVLAGYTFSYDGDVTGNHGSYSSDFWIIKIDANGTIVWKYSYGGSYDDEASAIALCSDGGFIVAGSTYSNNGDVTGNHGDSDYWVIRLNSSGQLQWQKCLGGSAFDEAYSITQTSDGGFIVSGRSSSNDGNVTGNHGGADCWIAKLNSSGTLDWQKSYGGTETEEANSIIETTDGNYVFFGYSSSNNGDVSGQHNPGSGNDDFWVVKINTTGTIIWQKCLGGSLSEQGQKIVKLNDGGFLLAGLCTSNDGDVSGIHSGFYSPDFWVVKINSSGNLVWQKCLGGSDQDEALSAYLTNDGGCVVSGFSYSTNGDVTGHHNQTDWWIVKLASFSSIENIFANQQIEIYPNPCWNKLHLKWNDPVKNPALCEIFSAEGKPVMTFMINPFHTEIDINSLKPGLYYISLRSEEVQYSGKFLKE